MPNYHRWSIAQSSLVTINDPLPLAAVGGDNATPFYLYFPLMPPGLQWVFPFTYGFLYPLPIPSYGGLLCDTNQRPAGAAAPPTSAALAQVTAYKAEVGFVAAFAPGAQSPSATIIRWNILSAPSTGVQASAVKAAAAGVTHVADTAIWSAAASAAPGAAAESSYSILDGATTLSTGVTALQNIAGISFALAVGPGLLLRGTPNTGMTINFAAGMAGIDERVSLAGYDQ